MQTKQQRIVSNKKYYNTNRKKQYLRVQNRKKELLEWYAELKKTLKCANCPENDPRCLDFHHINTKEKDATICYMVYNGYSKNRILKEMAKCIVICSNCHRKLTW